MNMFDILSRCLFSEYIIVSYHHVKYLKSIINDYCIPFYLTLVFVCVL